MIDLQKGTTLIEASAGTGKTYTLCRIALQLTLQKGITLDRILAVTFTEAATEELAGRIHSLYETALRELELDAVEEEIVKECMASDGFDREQAINALRYSLEIFDEAPISTIHSFCKRSLEWVALETSASFDAELSQVDNVLIEQLRSDYIRQNILEASSALSIALPGQKGFEDLLADIGKQTANHPNAILKPSPRPVDLDALERRFRQIPQALRALKENAKDLRPKLDSRKRIAKLLDGRIAGLAEAAARETLLPQDLALLKEFSEASWQSAPLKAHKGLPAPEIVALAESISEQIDDAFASLLFNFRPWLAERLERAKQLANVISFNDLLHLFRQALKGESGERVRAFIGSKFDAALIDEFQDTDQTQLDIVRSLFAHGEHYLFYIGDPKQAIYRFRGADIYAYFQATRSEALRRVVLSKNYRSAPGLVKAVNTIFVNATSGFFDERIEFAPVESGVDPAAFPSTVRPLRIHQLDLVDGEKPRGKGSYRAILAEQAASDFVERLEHDADFDPADATFLVNDRTEADLLAAALAKRGIVAAIRADRSVFQTQEAKDFEQVLAALSSPNKLSLKRGAFAALDRNLRACDMKGEAFERRSAPVFEYMSEWARDWFSLNFDVSFHTLLAQVDSHASSIDSERRYTNFCQLAELLSEARDADTLSPRGLLNWLRGKAEAEVSQNEDWQTRISSDEGKPQILTVHKSKGLEFPLVILPFLGLRRLKLDRGPLNYHGPDDALVIDFRPEEDSPAHAHARSEALAEDARLLYVALTRAAKETVAYLCPEEMSQEKNASSFAYFLLGDDAPADSSLVAEALQKLAEMPDSAIRFEKGGLADPPFKRIAFEAPRSESPFVSALSLRNRTFLPFPERVLSFSALNKALHLAEDDASTEALDEAAIESDEGIPEPSLPEAETSTEISIFTLPKGTHAGDLLHLILERFDFSRPDTLAETTRMAFETLQFEPREFEPIVAAQIDAIAKAVLQNDYSRFSLSQTRSASRVAELEFAYPVSGDVKGRLLDALQTEDLGAIPEAWRETLAGPENPIHASMLRGFIDLVLEHQGRLYIFDWKSNYLGPTPADYGEEAILQSMSEHNYFLQYLLYAVAVKRYAEWRHPDAAFEEVFGGVYYIYARGISPGRDTGIFYDRPPPALLDRLDQALGGRALCR